MKSTYITAYKDDDKLRISFNSLAEKTFGISFKRFFFFWDDTVNKCELHIIYIRLCNVIIRKYGKLVRDNISNIMKLRNRRQ
jgi:hypothetical protein